VGSVVDSLSISLGATATYNVVTAGGVVGTFDGITNSGTLNVDASSAKASTIEGSDGKDSITGGTGADKITGGTGADTIDAGAGADTLVYLLEDDLFTSGNVAVDTLAGGDGVDTLLVGTTGTTFTIATGDAWTGITDVEVIKAAANTHAVSVTLAASAATAGVTKVDLSLTTAASSNVIDVSAFTNANDTVLIGSSTSTGTANITGGAGVDNITAAAGGGTIDGGLGADVIYGGAGDDVLLYATTAALFDDSYLLIDSIRGGGGNDVLQIGTLADGNTGSAALTITADNKWARATTVETIKADTTGTVNITLNASAAAAGINKVDISASTEDTDSTIDVSAFGSLNGATLIGPSASTSAANITGGAGADTVTAAGGGGTVIGGAGSDTITGAAGVDTIVINATVGVKSDSNSTTTDTFKTFTLASDLIKFVATGVHDFEHSADVSVATSTGKIDLNGDGTLTGDGDVNIAFDAASLVGTLSSDFAGALMYDLTDTNLADTITGGELNDTITYTGGADDLDGGSGTEDTLVINQSETGKLFVNNSTYITGRSMFVIDSAASTISSTGASIIANNFEIIDASGQLNSTVSMAIIGTADANTLIGGAGDDIISGKDDTDSINGEAGDDYLIGDTTSSSAAIDTLIGGNGADYLRGSDISSAATEGGRNDSDLIFAGTQTILANSIYAEGTEVAGSKLNTSFSTVYSPWSTQYAAYVGANIVEGRSGNDILVASSEKDVFLYKTFANSALTSASKTAGNLFGTDVIHSFRVGEDYIATVMDIGGGDYTFVSGDNGQHSGSQVYKKASTAGWSVSESSGTVTLSFDSNGGGLSTLNGGGTATQGDFTITLVGVLGFDANTTTVNDFFVASTAA
jgi:Ca2+-binding RTX toxin-like protein